MFELRIPGALRSGRTCNAAAPFPACGHGHRCTLPACHVGPHRSEDFGCAWPAEAEVIAARLAGPSPAELDRRWRLAARQAGAALARAEAREEAGGDATGIRWAARDLARVAVRIRERVLLARADARAEGGG